MGCSECPPYLPRQLYAYTHDDRAAIQSALTFAFFFWLAFVSLCWFSCPFDTNSGSKQNWRSLSRTFASRLGYPIYTLDLRNHGTSPHARPHTYEAMARDLERFMKEQQLGEDGAATVNLMGHSM